MRPSILPALAPVLASVLVLAACKQAAPAPEPSASASSAASAAPAAPAAPPAVARKVEEENELYAFNYAYPAAAAAIPGLAKELEADLVKQRAELAAEAKEGRDDAKANGYDFNAHSRGGTWSVVTELPDWLSLSEEVYSFSGGAHPNHGYAALLWDKQANVRRQAVDLFQSKAALAKVIRRDFCARIDRERVKRRGGPLEPGGPFTDCIDPTDSAVILGSSNRQAFDRIGILVGPYEAGPYAEGDFEVTLPVTPAILAAVKPEYRRFFAVER
ncbi:MAG: DUF3298 and DUF4163 domain-containing protein [Novosphingobium sp.]